MVEAEREKLERLREASWRRCDDGRWSRDQAEEYLLVARAVRHALRPRPHAPADDRAGLAAASASPRSTWSARTASPRRSRMIAAILERHGAAHRRLPVAAPARRSPSASRSATPTSTAPTFARRGAARRAGGRARRPHARPTDDRVTQFEALTAAAYWELARARGRGRRRSRPGLGGRYDATNVIPSRGRGADQRRARAHALARADDRATSRAEKLAVVRAGRDAGASGELERRGGGGGASGRGPSGARLVHAARRPPAWRSRRCGGFQRRNFARRARRPPRRSLGPLDPAAVERGRARRSRVPGRLEVVGAEPLTAARRRAQPERASRRSRDALADVTASRRSSRWSRSSTTRTPRRCCARCCRAATPWSSRARPNPRALLAGDARDPGRRSSAAPGAEIERRARAARSSARGRWPGRGGAVRRDRLDLPGRRPASPRPARAPASVDGCERAASGPSFLAMIGAGRVVVAVVILVFFGIGYALRAAVPLSCRAVPWPPRYTRVAPS